jgi:diaminopimelate epimerase
MEDGVFNTIRHLMSQPQQNPQLWHHCHNSFLIIDELQGVNPITPTLVQELLSPHAVDGLVVLSKDNNNSDMFIIKEFFNLDGSRANYCGNAHICVATMALKKGVKTILFGNYKIETTPDVNDLFCYRLSPFKWDEVEIETIELESGIKGSFLSVGVPHFIITEKVADKEVITSYKKYTKDTLLSIQNDNRFPEGVNVTFILRDEYTPCGSISFERGLKHFSQACSSGIFACIKTLLHQNPQFGKKKVKWQTQKDHLEIQVEDQALLIYSKAHSIGEKI